MIELINKKNNLELTEKPSGTPGTPITIDSELSTTSTNPVQNKVITKKINEIEEYIDDIPRTTTDVVERDDATTLLFWDYDKPEPSVVIIPTVDTQLDESSNNPLANKAVYEAIVAFGNNIPTVDQSFDAETTPESANAQSGKAVAEMIDFVAEMWSEELNNKAEKTNIEVITDSSYVLNLLDLSNNNKEFRFTNLESLKINSIVSDDNNFGADTQFEIFLSFKTGSVSPTLSFNQNGRIRWTGDYVSNEGFASKANTYYSVAIWWDGSCFQGVVRGVSV